MFSVLMVCVCVHVFNIISIVGGSVNLISQALMFFVKEL